MTITTTDHDLYDIPLTAISPADDNPRQHLHGIDDLAASIQAVGLLEPLIVTGDPDSTDTTWTLVAGHRRLAACKKAGLTEVPCIVRPRLDDAARVEIMVIENLQREDLTPLEEAGAYAQLVGLGWTQRKIADRTGCNQSHVSKRIKLLELPDAAKAAVDDGTLTLEVAVELTKLDEKTVDKLLLRGSNISTHDVQRAIDTAAQKRKIDKAYAPHEKKGLKRVDDMYWHGKWEECTERLATGVHISPYTDRVTFLCEKVDQPKPDAATRKPAEETPAEKRARLKREQREAAKVTTIRDIVHNADVNAWQAIAVRHLDLADLYGSEFDQVLTALDIPTPAEDDPDLAMDRLHAYLWTSDDHARRLVLALTMIEGTWSDGIDGPRLRLLEAHGYKLDKDDRARLARLAKYEAEHRERGYLPAVQTDAERYCRICGCTEGNACMTLLGPCSWADDDLCTSCVDQAGTVVDPDAPTGPNEIRDAQAKADAAFAEANDLQPGDFVDSDGTIHRQSTIDDEISTADPARPDNAAENSNGTRGRRTRATATSS